MSYTARGPFEITSTPHPPYDVAEGAKLGRISIQKQLQGDLVGTSTVEMMTAMSDVKGSAGYVAIERFTGALSAPGCPARTGTFVLQHSGTMTRGAQSLTVTVVPDSATGELKGLSGAMKIDIVDNQHCYVFEFGFEVGEG